MPEENMRQSHFKYIFVSLAGGVMLMTVIMQMRVGSSGLHRLQDLIYDPDDDSSVRRPRRTHYHEHGNQEAAFVLRESNLGNPAFHGDNRQDVKIIHDGHKHGSGRHDHDHHWQVAQQYIPHNLPDERTVAIGCGITTRGHNNLRRDNLGLVLPFFKDLVQSFCRTATMGFDYNFFVAHDHNDNFFQQPDAHETFEWVFNEVVGRTCPVQMNVSLHMVECTHSGNPAWAQNDAMMSAYMDNMAYYYRVNDDTIMETTGWVEKFTDELQRFSPSNVGVVGPWFREGNVAILTHDFVHRTHIDIFGFYYPRVFTDWFADDWITFVYHPQRARKVAGVHVKHTMEMGSRYVVHYEKANQVQMEVEIGKMVVGKYLDRRQHSDKAAKLPDTKYVVAMSLTGGDMDYLYGALRYSQLVPILFPNWRVRMYVDRLEATTNLNKTKSARFFNQLVRKLEYVDVEVIKLEKEVTSVLPASMWAYHAADDEAVDRFIIRDSNTRPSEREHATLDEWLKTDKPLHCLRDHPYHSTKALVPSLVGGIPKQLKALVPGGSWSKLLLKYKSASTFLAEAIWPSLKDHCLCHDSVSCKKWPGAHPFPVLRKESEFVGQRYDSNDQTIDHDEEILWNKTFIQPECVFLKNTGFAESTVKAVIRHRPVMWSQDYHVTPMMDIKSLLAPIGVKVHDNSFSYYCAQVGSCAKGIKYITRDNGMRLTPEIIDQFYDYYKNDIIMNTVTTFVCTLPVSMCEAFVKFNRSMLILATIRYEQARPEPARWQALNEMLVNVSKHPKSLVAANNLYDSKYIEYFTGLKPLVIPNYCEYLKDSYNPTRRHFLLTPIHSTELYERFFTDLDEVVMKRQVDVSILPLRQLYPQYLFSDLAAHPGIIYIPYQVSMISLTEQYRMNIPLFLPTLDLLARWHVEYQVVRHRTWSAYMKKRSGGSDLTGLIQGIPDPNNDLEEDAVKFWLQFADYYQWPHIIYFESVEDLVDKMLTVDLKEISRRMQEHNTEARQQIKDVWSTVLLKLTEGVPIA